MRNYLHLTIVTLILLCVTKAAYCQDYSSSPESTGIAATSVPTPTPTPTPTNFGNCPDGQKYDFADGRCEDCLYAITNIRDTMISDGDPNNTIGHQNSLNPDDHWQDSTFGPDDVVLGIGSPDRSSAFNDIQNFLDNTISACYQPNPNYLDANGTPIPVLTPPPTQTPNARQAADPNYSPPPTATPNGGRYDTPYETGWNSQFSQCVSYRSYARFHLLGLNPDGSWSTAQDPRYSFQFLLPQGHRWHFSDINELWVRNSNGELVRRDLPNGAYLEDGSLGMYISYFDKDGTRIDPTTILDPRYTSGERLDANLDPNFGENRSPQLRAGLNRTLCYTWEVRGVASPISLFMPGCDMRELEPTIVKFPLNPNDNNSYAIWKASKCMPLLVYDPSHSGKVTSGKQLLGDWTNGGAPTYDGSVKPWKHGFQVLATFDKDGDGIVSGKELGVLSVWSDDNQNGVSEEGEVRSALEFGVKQLRYQAPKNFRHGDLFIESGYKLKQKGEVVDGMLIDWYGHTASSELELVQHLPFNAVSTEKSPINKYRRKCSETDLGSFAGGWKWWLNSDSGKVPRGYLTLGQKSADKLVGSTYSMQSAQKKGTNLALMLGVWPLEADVRGREATMKIPSGLGSVVSEIKLGADGKSMTGTTRSTSGKGQSDVYAWTAERVGCQLD